VGDTQVLSDIDSFDNIMQVSEYWWESGWLDGQVVIRLGKQDFNTEFQCIDGAESFIQSTFGLSPFAAFPTYPDQSMAAVALVQLSDSVRLEAGAWSAFARGGT
jgi:carbohydrate-selective porin OprB